MSIGRHMDQPNLVGVDPQYSTETLTNSDSEVPMTVLNLKRMLVPIASSPILPICY